jgi:hypothetical protein
VAKIRDHGASVATRSHFQIRKQLNEAQKRYADVVRTCVRISAANARSGTLGIRNRPCQCEACCSACEHKPGWFKPEEIAPLAKAMGLTEQELFDQHLMVDWWVGDEHTDMQNVFVLSPATVNIPAGDMSPFDARGVCHWFKNGKCAVHKLGKPYECGAYHHTDNGEVNHHRDAADAWNKPEHQDKIRELLGREPEVPDYTLADAVTMMFARLGI